MTVAQIDNFWDSVDKKYAIKDIGFYKPLSIFVANFCNPTQFFVIWAGFFAKGVPSLALRDSDKMDNQLMQKNNRADSSPKYTEYLFPKDGCSSFFISLYTSQKVSQMKIYLCMTLAPLSNNQAGFLGNR